MSSASHHALLGRLAAGENLSFDETSDAVEGIMRGFWTEGEIGLFLTGLRDKGETEHEVAGAAAAMRGQMRRIASSRTGIIDTCGTGGVGSTIFNVSTTAALVTAAAGVPVAKHGNRRVTSRSGSADVLAELGVKGEHLDKFAEMAAADPTAGSTCRPFRSQVAESDRFIHRRQAC